MNIYEPDDYPKYSGRGRRETERETEENKNRRGHRWLGFSILLVATGCGALAWLAYPILQEHEAAAGKLPGIQESVDSLGDRIAATDATISEWSNKQEELRTQTNGALGTLRTRLAASVKDAQATASALFSKAQAELAKQAGELRTRIAGVESSREIDRASLDALEQELSQTRNQLAAQDRQLADLRGNLEQQARQNAQEFAGAQRDLANLGQRQARDRSDFDSLAENVERKRIDFEVQKNHSVDVAPGIAIAIHKTNVSYQRASGWVSAPDRRTIWLRDLPTQEPVVLISSLDGRKQELVLTRVSENSVVGYVVLPADAVRGEPRASAATTGAERAGL